MKSTLHLTQPTITAVPLTAEDVAAWKLSTDWSLHTHPTLDVGAGSIVRLYVRVWNTPPIFTTRQQRLFPNTFSTTQRTRDIMVDASAHGYDNEIASTGWTWPSWTGAERQEPVPACFDMGSSDAMFQTIGRALKVGSVLSLKWTADNNTETAREAGLHLDEVRLVADTGTRKDEWAMGHATCRDNSARMVQRSRY